MFWTLCMILFIMEWGVVHILELGVVLRGLMGKLFIETVITGGEGIGFPFYQYWVFVCQMNYTHLPLTYLRLKNNFPSLHEGHIGEEAGLLLLKGSFSQFCGVTDEEWCSSRYLWVISFGAAATHSSNNGLLGQVSRATTHDSEHFQSWICRNITVFDQPVVNHLLLVVCIANTAFQTFLVWESFTFSPFSAFFCLRFFFGVESPPHFLSLFCQIVACSL